MATHPSILPRESYGQRSLSGFSPWGSKKLDMTEHKKKKEGNKPDPGQHSQDSRKPVPTDDDRHQTISRANKLVPEADRAKRWTALPKITDLKKT